MKKVLICLAAVAALTALASCDTKMCYCYEDGYEQQVYINPDTPCSSLTQGNRGCVESYERMNPDETAKK